MHISNISLLGPHDVFYTVTNEDTKRTNSQSTRYGFFEAQREAQARIARGVSGVYVLQAIELHTPVVDRYKMFKDARAAGRVIQFRSPQLGVNWQDCGRYEITWEAEPPENYRIKPEPIYISLSMEDIPATCWMRPPSQGYEMLVQTVNKHGIGLATRPQSLSFNAARFDGWEYSSDRKTWKRCQKFHQP